MNNLYVVDGGPFEHVEAIDPELGGPLVDDYAIELIVAETSGKAKSALFRQHRRYIEYTDIKVRLLARNVDPDPCDPEYYWMNAEAALHPTSFDEIRWQDLLNSDSSGRDPFPEPS